MPFEEYLDPVLVAETYSGLSLVQCEVQLFDEQVDEFLVSRYLVVGQLVLDVDEGLFTQVAEDGVHGCAPGRKMEPPEEAPQGVWFRLIVAVTWQDALRRCPAPGLSFEVHGESELLQPRALGAQPLSIYGGVEPHGFA